MKTFTKERANTVALSDYIMADTEFDILVRSRFLHAP